MADLVDRLRQPARAGRGTGFRTRGRRRARDSQWVERAGRLGHVAKGVSYALIAVLALQVAFGHRQRTGDRQGVLREIAGKPFGTGVLIALGVGFFCYALWQFVRTALDRTNDGSGPKGLAKRAQHGVVGAVYVASGVAAVSLALGTQAGTSGNERAETARVLDWPFGPWIVGAVGVALLVYGLSNAYKAMTEKFRKDLREVEMGGEMRTWAVRLGVVGHAARGVVFVLVGFFLTKAAIEYDPDEAIGIDGALAKLADQDYGTWLLTAVALGLMAYALFCLVQARYRRV
jgi:Domain of Unknown Function (DUF1206)